MSKSAMKVFCPLIWQKLAEGITSTMRRETPYPTGKVCLEGNLVEPVKTLTRNVSFRVYIKRKLMCASKCVEL